MITKSSLPLTSARILSFILGSVDLMDVELPGYMLLGTDHIGRAWHAVFAEHAMRFKISNEAS